MSALLSLTEHLQALVCRQKAYTEAFFEGLDLAEVEAFCQMILTCEGQLYFCGVGKSGILAEKIALTLSSTGQAAAPLSIVNALHGDLGLLGEKDIVVLLSKSGQTDELLALLPYIRNKGSRTAAWVCSQQSRLEKSCDLTVHLPCEAELCPFDLAPTTSGVAQLLMGDLVTVALMEMRGFTLEEYAQNHPSGRIGKRIVMKVGDLMVKGSHLPTTSPDRKLLDLLVLFSDKRSGCLLVTNEKQHLLGIFTDGDLRRALQIHGPSVLELPIGQLMTREPRCIAASELAYEAMKVMEADQQHPVMILPVVEGLKLVGLIRMHDILQAGL